MNYLEISAYRLVLRGWMIWSSVISATYVALGWLMATRSASSDMQYLSLTQNPNWTKSLVSVTGTMESGVLTSIIVMSLCYLSLNYKVFRWTCNSQPDRVKLMTLILMSTFGAVAFPITASVVVVSPSVLHYLWFWISEFGLPTEISLENWGFAAVITVAVVLLFIDSVLANHRVFGVLKRHKEAQAEH